MSDSDHGVPKVREDGPDKSGSNAEHDDSKEEVDSHEEAAADVEGEGEGKDKSGVYQGLVYSVYIKEPWCVHLKCFTNF